MVKFAFNYFNIDHKKYILINKKYFRKTDIKNKKSDYSTCLKRNKIKRNITVYGKKIITLLIKKYLNEKKY